MKNQIKQFRNFLLFFDYFFEIKLSFEIIF